MTKLPTPQVNLLLFTIQVPTTTGQHLDLDLLVYPAIHHLRMEPHTQLELDHHLDLAPISPQSPLHHLIKSLPQATIQARHTLHPRIPPVAVHPRIHPVAVHPRIRPVAVHLINDPRLPSNQSCHPQQDRRLTQVAWLDPHLFHHLPMHQVHPLLTNQSNPQSMLTVALTLLVDLTLLNKVNKCCPGAWFNG